MTKKKKLLITITSVVVFTGLAAAAYFIYEANRVPEPPKEEVKSAAKTEYEKLNRTGDGDLATQFISYVKIKDTTSAKKVFEDEIKATTDKAAKIDLLQQYIVLCLDYELKDAALDSAKQVIALAPTHHNYAAAAQVYGARGDTDSQISYFQKAIDAAKADKGDASAAAAVSGYQANIDILNSKDRVR